MPTMPEPKIMIKADAENLERCAALLAGDELVAVPTETVYGLAGNCFSESAVRKIFSVKGRPLIDPLISHFYSAAHAFEHVLVTEEARKLAKVFWPGALTMVLTKKSTIPDLVTAGMPTAAVRVPGHPILRSLLDKVSFPLAAPSANPFGYVSPTRPEHVLRTLGDKIPAILDGGTCELGLESTIVDLRKEGHPAILRPGPISNEALTEVLGVRVVTTTRDAEDGAAQSAPGMLSKHYSPKASIKILPHGYRLSADNKDMGKNTAIILNSKPSPLPENTEHVFWLSETADLKTIASNFFHLIQKLDQTGYEQIQVEAAPDHRIGIAINDRLTRAATL